jgi:hypothetical protein
MPTSNDAPRLRPRACVRLLPERDYGSVPDPWPSAAAGRRPPGIRAYPPLGRSRRPLGITRYLGIRPGAPRRRSSIAVASRPVPGNRDAHKRVLAVTDVAPMPINQQLRLAANGSNLNAQERANTPGPVPVCVTPTGAGPQWRDGLARALLIQSRTCLLWRRASRCPALPTPCADPGRTSLGRWAALTASRSSPATGRRAPRERPSRRGRAGSSSMRRCKDPESPPFREMGGTGLEQ